ncbi:guanylate kinase [Pseudooceanicola batsensis HTCC2597]|uniref:Guanylate kinase n=2 Tax=Pseudooceanicola batsensis TaxID=314255 RepID=A3TXP4_PSEBH|nr:guanylate kinase [Pseudooceanicola batsensis HTCC2597]
MTGMGKGLRCDQGEDMAGPSNERRGLLIILSSPSGAGKSTLARRLRDWDETICFSVSATTRPPRPGEVDGQDYHFLSESAFKALVADGGMLEHAHVFGNFYGSPKAAVEEATQAGQDVLFDIDWQGAQQIRNSSLGQHTLSIFLLPPSITELHRRLKERGQDSPEVIAGRMRKSWDEISHWDAYDFVLVNDNLDDTEARLRAILTASRLRRTQQPRLTDHVRKLQMEFEETQ